MGTRVSVVGAQGRLGSVVASVVDRADDLELVARVGSADPMSAALGPADAPADVVVDATRLDVSQRVVETALDAGRRVVVGTSGWSEDRLVALRRRVSEATGSGVVVIPNFSLGSALASAFAAVAARFYDSVEILEAHGAAKVDSPSGTAVRTAELIAAARAERGPVDAPHSDQRARGQRVASVPVHSIRMDGVVARQEVLIGGPGELLTLAHTTTDARAYEAGILLAIRAAASTTGVVVGLDALVDLGVGVPAVPPASAVTDAR